MNGLRIIGREDLDRLSGVAAASARRRLNLNLHPQLDDPIQRLFNAMEPSTYVRPHRHARDGGWELMMALRGAFSILTFDDAGTVTERVDLRASGESVLAEIPAHTWHAVTVLQPGTIMFEVKAGPYSPVHDKDFARWAPLEGDEASNRFVQWYRDARLGDRPPDWPE
ncbi:MAG: WbuC family cupin fold metalloprotein [Methylotetracoccus sp.]